MFGRADVQYLSAIEVDDDHRKEQPKRHGHDHEHIHRRGVAHVVVEECSPARRWSRRQPLEPIMNCLLGDLIPEFL